MFEWVQSALVTNLLINKKQATQKAVANVNLIDI